MIRILDPTIVLLQRQEFLEGIAELASLCNWAPKDIQELKELLWDEIVEIDNILFEIFEATQDRDIAYLTWNNRMEDLRRWLGLMMGIKIKYV